MSQRPFVLLITSEELNPKNIHSSCFELNLATCLVNECEVAIMSISHENSLIALGKDFFMKPSIHKFAFIFRYLQKLLLNPIEVKHHIIKGISVKEVVGVRWFSGMKTPVSALLSWTELGKKGFYKTYSSPQKTPLLIHAHSRFLMAGYLAFILKEEIGIPYVYTEHSTFYQRKLIHPSLKNYIAKAINNSNYFTAVSMHLYNTVNTFIGGINVLGSVLYNALDDLYQQPINRSVPLNPILINIATLEEKKNQAALIHAFALLKDNYPTIQLQFVGTGSDLPMLKQLANEEGISNSVQFLGYQSPLQIKSLLDRATIFVLPSIFETFGVAVIEALSRGVPVVVTECGGPEEYFEESLGQMIAGFDSKSLASAIQLVLNNYGLYQPEAIRTYCIGKFGDEAILKQHKNIYETVLNNI